MAGLTRYNNRVSHSRDCFSNHWMFVYIRSPLSLYFQIHHGVLLLLILLFTLQILCATVPLGHHHQSIRSRTGWLSENAVDSCSVRIWARTPALLTENFRRFSQSLGPDAGIVLQLGQNRFLPDNFPPNIHHHHVIRHYTVSIYQVYICLSVYPFCSHLKHRAYVKHFV